MTHEDLRTYEELLSRTDAPPGSSWGLFGADETAELGTLTRLSNACVMAGVRSVLQGDVFPLDYAADAFDPPVIGNRVPPRHVITSRHRDHRDDHLDGYNPQCSSQIDGLRHRRHSDYGFYNGVPDEEIQPGSRALGVQLWAEKGVAGRGVLLDLARVRSAGGSPILHEHGEALPVALLDQAAEEQGVRLARGDIVLLRTGWAEWYLRELDGRGREEMRSVGRFTGLGQSREVLAWFWDHGLSMVASDTLAVEVLPALPSSPFHSDTDGGMMHQEILALLGLPIGELWKLDSLAANCHDSGTYEFLLVSSPQNIVGGVASVAHATAIK